MCRVFFGKFRKHGDRFFSKSRDLVFSSVSLFECSTGGITCCFVFPAGRLSGQLELSIRDELHLDGVQDNNFGRGDRDDD